jgi:hypothetical protein
MNYQADFTEGTILFQKAEHKPPDLSHIQGAMFLDRPDLWPPRRRRKSYTPPPGQPELFTTEE